MQHGQQNIVFLYSGQGSHYRDMGKDLYAANQVFRNSIDRFDSIIYQNTGMSLTDELYRYDEEVFDSVLITHPAIVATELAMTAVLKEMGILPAAVLGVSLGEFAASAAAGMISPEEALIISIEQAKLVSQKVEDGGMTVVINPKNQLLTDYMEERELYDQCINFNGCFTVSGLRKDLDEFDEFLGQNGIVFQRLDVEYPFHSPFLELAKLYWLADISMTESDKGDQPVMYSALSGRQNTNPVTADFFWDVVSKPYDLPATVRQIEADLENTRYLDLGPSGTMATFLKYIRGAKGDVETASAILTPHYQAQQKLDAIRRTIRPEHVTNRFSQESGNSDEHKRFSKIK